MIKSSLAVAITLSLTPLVASASEDRGFAFVARKAGVTVLRARDSSPARFVAEGDLPGQPAEVLRVLLDYERQIDRFPRIAESRVLRQHPGVLLVYQRLRLPVVSDRDYILRVRYGADGARTWVRYETDNDSGPAPRDGIVRAPLNRGNWQLAPTRDGASTHARFEMSIDLGGWVPGFLARRGAADEIPILFQRIREALGQP